MMNIDLLTGKDLLEFEERLVQRLQQTQTQLKRWLRSKEVCNMLGVSPSGLQNMRVQGLIPFSKLGSSVYYPLDGIEKALNSNLVQANI